MLRRLTWFIFGIVIMSLVAFIFVNPLYKEGEHRFGTPGIERGGSDTPILIVLGSLVFMLPINFVINDDNCYDYFYNSFFSCSILSYPKLPTLIKVIQIWSIIGGAVGLIAGEIFIRIRRKTKSKASR